MSNAVHVQCCPTDMNVPWLAKSICTKGRLWKNHCVLVSFSHCSCATYYEAWINFLPPSILMLTFCFRTVTVMLIVGRRWTKSSLVLKRPWKNRRCVRGAVEVRIQKTSKGNELRSLSVHIFLNLYYFQTLIKQTSCLTSLSFVHTMNLLCSQNSDYRLMCI